MKIPYLFPFLFRFIRVNQSVIFVDYFDTVCYRYIHSSQVTPQWARVIFNKFPNLSKKYNINQFCKRREELAAKNIDQTSSYEILYNEFAKIVNIDFCKFIEFCKEAELAVEIGCQYPNREMLSFLYKQKKYGKKIYLVTDFHMSNDVYKIFLAQFGCTNLFDGIYVSHDIGKDKYHGGLYSYILDDLRLSSNDVIMIGDSLHSDVKMAYKKGIKLLWYFPILHKLKTNYYLKMGKSYNVYTHKGNQLRRQTVFEEYALPLLYFCGRLYKMMKKNELKNANFLSRGGYLMKKCFDVYQYFMNSDHEEIKSSYLKTSRKVCFKAYDAFMSGNINSSDYLLFKEYLDDFKEEDGRICLVDEGWYNHSQQCITKIYNMPTYGFYIGSCEKDDMGSLFCYREGLLFNKDISGKKSPYYNILTANRALYEQLFTSSDGSVKGYIRNKLGVIQAVEKIDEKELFLFEKYTDHIQKTLLYDMKGIAAWTVGHKNLNLRTLASLMLSSALLNNKKRCAVLNIFDEHRVDNFTDGKKNDTKTIKDINFSLYRLVIHPSEYVSAISKLQRHIYKNHILEAVYRMITPIIIGYIKLSYLWDR